MSGLSRAATLGALSFCALLVSGALLANPVQGYLGLTPTGSVEIPSTKAQFLYPNEINPRHSKAILETSKSGIYLSVGTERSFIGAALSNADKLLVVDRDAEVIFFGRINAALLAMASDLKNYRALRSARNHQEWLEAAQKLGGESILDRKFITESRTFEWWKKRVANSKLFEAIENPENRSFKIAGELPFQEANYLEDENLFKKLQAMSRSGDMEFVVSDLTDRSGLNRIVDRIRSRGLRIAVVDLSNAWQESYIGNHLLGRLFRRLAPVLDPNTIVMSTWVETLNPMGGWNYTGVRHGEMSRFGYRKYYRWLEQLVRDSRSKPELVLKIIDRVAQPGNPISGFGDWFRLCVWGFLHP